jgi:hypothetical protein
VTSRRASRLIRFAGSLGFAITVTVANSPVSEAQTGCPGPPYDDAGWAQDQTVHVYIDPSIPAPRKLSTRMRQLEEEFSVAPPRSASAASAG